MADTSGAGSLIRVVRHRETSDCQLGMRGVDGFLGVGGLVCWDGA